MDRDTSSAVTTDDLRHEVARRRTFAIISPDAGKTTLTEKLLLYAGAVELAGAVRRRGRQHHATADWIPLEQARGISLTASALEVEYGECRIHCNPTVSIDHVRAGRGTPLRGRSLA